MRINVAMMSKCRIWNNVNLFSESDPNYGPSAVNTLRVRVGEMEWIQMKLLMETFWLESRKITRLPVPTPKPQLPTPSPPPGDETFHGELQLLDMSPASKNTPPSKLILLSHWDLGLLDLNPTKYLTSHWFQPTPPQKLNFSWRTWTFGLESGVGPAILMNSQTQ